MGGNIKISEFFRNETHGYWTSRCRMPDGVFMWMVVTDPNLSKSLEKSYQDCIEWHTTENRSLFDDYILFPSEVDSGFDDGLSAVEDGGLSSVEEGLSSVADGFSSVEDGFSSVADGVIMSRSFSTYDGLGDGGAIMSPVASGFEMSRVFSN